MASFEKRTLEENTWTPEVCGVDFTKRLYKMLGEMTMDEAEAYTVWVTVDDDSVGEGYTEQVTPDNSRLFLSVLDDDSDVFTLLDKRDGLWFNFMRLEHQEYFDTICETVAPWTTMTTRITPMDEAYKRYLEAVSKDMAGDELVIPDDWS